ncbi:hypothetical protein pb186bvf_016576 [Paramecium bursaria]
MIVAENLGGCRCVESNLHDHKLENQEHLIIVYCLHLRNTPNIPNLRQQNQHTQKIYQKSKSQYLIVFHRELNLLNTKQI